MTTTTVYIFIMLANTHYSSKTFLPMLNNVSLLGHVSKIVSILLSKLAIVPVLTHRCATVTTDF